MAWTEFINRLDPYNPISDSDEELEEMSQSMIDELEKRGYSYTKGKISLANDEN